MNSILFSNEASDDGLKPIIFSKFNWKLGQGSWYAIFENKKDDVDMSNYKISEIFAGFHFTFC